MMRCFSGLLCVAVAFAQPNPDAVVERARQAFDVPGIAVAIVKDGRVVMAKGYGVRRLGGSEPVTPNSLFRIASNTKAFTTAALAMLVDEGKLRWDDRVIDHLPSFQMYDPYVTREMTVRDLLVHRSGLGLGAGDLMFWPATDFTRDEIIRRIRFLKPATSFRSGYAYDNLLYLVAGQIVANISGKSWEEFVRDRIFVPLGMTHTNASTRALMAAADVAAPHARADGKLVTLEQTDHDNNAPAGSINSCVSDLAKWVTVQLNRGKPLFSEARSREMWSGQTILPIEDGPAKPTFYEYGLGWFLRDYRGRKMVYHTGTLAGYVSRVTMIPEINLGVIVLTNQEESGAHASIAYSIVDQYLGGPATDWVAAFKQQATEEVAPQPKRVPNTSPSLPLAAYAGRYRDPWYGDVVVEEANGTLTIRFSHTKQLTGTLSHWHYDTFVARWNDRTLNADAFVTFSIDTQGALAGARMEPVSPLTDFSFDFQDLDLRRMNPSPTKAEPNNK